MLEQEFLNNLWAECHTPPDRSPVWEWAERNIEAIPYSPMPGRFRVDNSPMLREVMEAIVDPRVRLVSIIASVQSAKTTGVEVSLCYIIANLPGPMLWLTQTDEDAKDVAESRLARLIDNCPPARALYPADKNKKRNTTIYFSNGMTMWVAGAYNKKNLQTRSIRWLIGDETWLWPPGHMAEAEARVTAFGWLGKCVFMSQGGVAGDDTHNKHDTTDKREWCFCCPKCGKYQPFKWECVSWDNSAVYADGTADYNKLRESTIMKCAECGHVFRDSDATRRKLNASAKFIPQNERAASTNVGFHWNALATMSWGALAELFLRAKAAVKKADYSLMQQFYQKRLGLPWNDISDDLKTPVTYGSYRMGEEWSGVGVIGATPLKVLTVDVQSDHFYTVVRYWDTQGNSRMIWAERVGSWEAIANLQARFGVPANLVFIDCGYTTYEVYKRCAENGWNALKGDSRATYPHKLKTGKPIERFYSKLRRVNVGASNGKQLEAKMYFWSNLNIKDSLAMLRRAETTTEWLVPGDAPQAYIDMLDSEFRCMEKGKWIWRQKGKSPNHFLDCEAMQVCAATMLKIIGAESVAPQV